MTFSLLGLCRRTGQFGAVVTTSSPCVRARVPFLAAGVGGVLNCSAASLASRCSGMYQMLSVTKHAMWSLEKSSASVRAAQQSLHEVKDGCATPVMCAPVHHAVGQAGLRRRLHGG